MALRLDELGFSRREKGPRSQNIARGLNVRKGLNQIGPCRTFGIVIRMRGAHNFMHSTKLLVTFKYIYIYFYINNIKWYI